jgi:FixJ family two-component response regulator
MAIWSTIPSVERDICNLVAHGSLNKEVSRDLRMPIRTVEDRRRNLMRRIGGRDITDLVRFAVKVETILMQEAVRHEVE